MPRPDSSFEAMVRGQWRRAEYAMALSGKSFEDALQHALLHYWRACHDWDSGRGYDPVDFVGGRVVVRVRNFVRADRGRHRHHGPMPSDEEGLPLDRPDEDSLPPDVAVLLGEVREIAARAIGLSADIISSTFAMALSGDSASVELIRGAVETAAVETETETNIQPESMMTSSKKQYVRPVGSGRDGARILFPSMLAFLLLVTPEHVEAGRALAAEDKELDTKSVDALADALGDHDNLADAYLADAGLDSMKTEDPSDEDAAALLAWIDDLTEVTVAASGRGYECAMDDGGCGSIIPDETVAPTVCPYCGTSLEEGDEDPHADLRALLVGRVADVKKAITGHSGDSVLEDLATLSKLEKSGKNRGSILTHITKMTARNTPTPSSGAKPGGGSAKKGAKAKKRGGTRGGPTMLAIGRALADKHGWEIKENPNYDTVYVDKDGKRVKIGIVKSKVAFAAGAVPEAAWKNAAAKCPAKDGVEVRYVSQEERKKKHLGRDSVAITGVGEEALEYVLLRAAENAGERLEPKPEKPAAKKAAAKKPAPKKPAAKKPAAKKAAPKKAAAKRTRKKATAAK